MLIWDHCMVQGHETELKVIENFPKLHTQLVMSFNEKSIRQQQWFRLICSNSSHETVCTTLKTIFTPVVGKNFRPYSHTICEISQKFPHQKTFYIVKDAGTRDNWKVYEVKIKNKTCETYIIWEKATEKRAHGSREGKSVGREGGMPSIFKMNVLLCVWQSFSCLCHCKCRKDWGWAFFLVF